MKEDTIKNKGKNKMIFTMIVLTILAFAICLMFKPLFGNLKFGLDLQGGFEVLYEVESIDGSRMTSEKMNSTYKTLSKRIDSLGVSEPEIILEGNNRIRVKLAGVENEDEARKQLSTVATLSFRDTKDNLLMSSDVLKSGGAKLTSDSAGRPAVLLSVKNKDKFYAVTNRVKDYEENAIVIWLDYEDGVTSYVNEKNNCGTSGSNCLSAATVSQGFASDVIIQGNFTEEEASNLVDLINSGSLPSKLKEVSSKTVAASFGDATLNKTLLAGIIGIIIIMLILIYSYHLSGFVFSIAMLLYTFLVFFIFWLVGGVLTLPGIAALVLGIGMAVDANIITYSRIKEELYQGRSLEVAFHKGAKESASSILDSNLTTLLVAVIMFVFGESSVKGFSTMLMITIFVTIFSMVFITRIILRSLIKTGYFNDKTNLFIHVKKEDIPNLKKGEKIKVVPFSKINFLGYTKLFVTFSVLILMVGGIFFIKERGFNLGVDFKSGSDISLVTSKKLSSDELEKDIKSLSLDKENIALNEDGADILVRDVFAKEKVEEVKGYFIDKYDAKVDIGVVSNVVKKELIKNAILSVLLAAFGIVIYISLRFKFSYALSGVLALFHDVFVIFAVFAIFRFEVSSMFIAAILAIIGYSINDTIVLFDRIRENINKTDKKKLDKEKLYELVNSSIRETFTRTIYTSLTTLIPVISLIVLGSHEIINFNIAMLIGLFAGTYSSIFIATLFFLFVEKRALDKPEKKKKVYKDEMNEKMIKGINC